MPLVGYDAIVTPPAAAATVACPVCGDPMGVVRSRKGATGWAAGVAKMGTDHDLWTCPNFAQEWHHVALRIVQANEREPSLSVAALRRKDLDEILKSRELG